MKIVSLAEAAEIVMPGWSRVEREPSCWRWEMFDAPMSIKTQFEILCADQGQRAIFDGNQFVVNPA